MKIKSLATSGIIAALYIAVSLLVAPIAFGAIQYRISEIFNHLIVFNKKYFFGIVIGVLITNLFSPMAAYDLIFGVAHTVLSLLITIFATKFIKGNMNQMIFNTIVFTFMSFIIAFELKLAFELPFFYSWLTVAIGEFVVLAVGIPIMNALNNRLNFHSQI